MTKRQILIVGVAVAIAAAASDANKSYATDQPRRPQQGKKLTHRDRAAAAARAKAYGRAAPAPGTAAKGAAAARATAMAPADPVPYYFSKPNYANSPLPTVSGTAVPVGNTLVPRAYATDYATPPGMLGPVLVILPASLPAGMLQAFQTFNQASPGGSPSPSEGGLFHAYVLRPTGTNGYLVIFDSGEFTVPPLPATNTGAGQVETFSLPNAVQVQAGDQIGFYGQGIPVDVGAGTDVLSYPAPARPLQDTTITVAAGDANYPVYPEARTYSFGALVLNSSNVSVSGGLRKFVDTLPRLGAGGVNNLGQYIPVAVPDTTTYPGSDYYEIGLVQYEEQMHSDLPPTLLRGYVQLSTNAVPGNRVPLCNTGNVPLPANGPRACTPIVLPGGQQALGVDRPHYLGPLLAATKNKPVRILFRNLLPTSLGGDLFLPVDTTVMGSGMGPNMGGMAEMDPQNPMCGMSPKPAGCYAENRATLHLHGGITPWISDGTPHQWITPAGDTTAYPQGVSVTNVPDMPDPGPGAQTFFYTNQQSARLMFYHDHAWGITRLNVYAGEAAPYLLTDPTEQKLVGLGLLPSDQIPLVIQDKTFVPSAQQFVTDPLWDVDRWGGFGSLWVPHVYSPAENPGDASGANAFGRWAYGPWFWPPTTATIAHGPMANPHFDPACDSDTTWCEPPLMPGVPYLSMGMESFHDTPVVNGTAYPTTELEPKPYRLRILNAANDRFFNLQLYVADASGTEVALNPAEVAAALLDPNVFPTPVAGNRGPDWIQVGTEGGFLPAPAVIPPQPITWVTDQTVFNAGNVDKHSLLLGPAERADVVVDFSKFAGKTLILYNDAPAAFPARDPRYDYYTGNADLTDTGGAPSTLPGYGPNTRTIMQIRVRNTAAAAPFNLAALQAAFAHKADGSGVFESSQNPIIVGQAAYNSAYGTAFRSTAPRDGIVRIHDFSLTFDTLRAGPLTMAMKLKAIQDEMGEAFEKDYGRMSGNLGVELPGAQAGAQNLVLYPYVNPASEIVKGIELPVGVEVTPIASTTDGAQLWRITHNGVDTHPIHFHLFDVQVLNRVGWDGLIRKPDANEFGWKDTLRVSPLEDTIVALRPIVPKAPFGVPDSVRPLNPMMPLGNTDMFVNIDPDGNAITPPLANTVVNFGWEYVWHCHILSHEEMDMMRPISLEVSRQLPAAPALTLTRSAGGDIVSLAWTDGTPFSILAPTPPSAAPWGDPANEIGFRIERASISNYGQTGSYAPVGSALANQTRTVDTKSLVATTSYFYRVVAYNAVGESASSPVRALGVGATPAAAPTNLVATLQGGAKPTVSLSWTDNATNEAAFVVERSVNGGAFVQLAMPPARSGTGAVTYVDATVQTGNAYAFRVAAVNSAGMSPYSNTVTAITVTLPAAPTNLTAAVQTGPQVGLSWNDRATNESGFVVERRVGNGQFVQIATAPARAGTGTVTFTDSAVQGGITYSYRVQAVNAAGGSAYTNTATVSVPTLPAAPSNLRASSTQAGANQARITLTWTDNANNETGFTIQRATNAAFTAGLVTNTVGANTRTFQTANVPRNVTYYFRVQAYNAGGASGWVTVSITP